MLKEIETHRGQIAGLCRRYGVKRLELFGSAARGTDFEPGPGRGPNSNRESGRMALET